MRSARPFLTLVLVAFAASIVAFTAGCAGSPTERWAAARIGLNAAQDSIVELHAAGVLSDEDLVATKPVVLPARKTLDAIEATLPAGSPNLDGLLVLVQSATAELARLSQARILAAEQQGRPPPQ